MKGSPVILVLCAALTGCAAITPYQAMDRDGGYSEQKLEDNRFQVRFAGNRQTPRDTVQNYLLFRAAELTLQNGHDYFVTLHQDTEASTTQYQTISFGTGFGRWRWTPFGAVGVATTRAATEFIAEAQIRTFAGTKPPANPDAFDARQIVRNLGPSIIRPADQSGD